MGTTSVLTPAARTAIVGTAELSAENPAPSRPPGPSRAESGRAASVVTTTAGSGSPRAHEVIAGGRGPLTCWATLVSTSARSRPLALGLSRAARVV